MGNFCKVVSEKFIRITWFLMFVSLLNVITLGISLMALNKADFVFVGVGVVGIIILFTIDVWIIRYIKHWIVKQCIKSPMREQTKEKE